jgi:hypothetical protein
MAPLTNEMRAWLGAQHTDCILFYDLVQQFMSRFDLDARTAGKLLAQWVWETV